MTYFSTYWRKKYEGDTVEEIIEQAKKDMFFLLGKSFASTVSYARDCGDKIEIIKSGRVYSTKISNDYIKIKVGITYLQYFNPECRREFNQTKTFSLTRIDLKKY